MMEIAGYKYWLHQFYQDNLDIVLKEAIPNKWDCVGIFLGIEGAGKSTLATQTSLYLDPSFNLDKTIFTPGSFSEATDENDPEAAILWDEAITGANIRNYAEEMNRSIVSKMTQIRSKRQKFLLCFPYLYLLEKYFVSRATFGVYVYAKDFNNRGFAYFYNQPQLETLYNMMKSRFSHNPQEAIRHANCAFKFKFDKTFCLPEKEYEAKKNAARQETENSQIPARRLIQELLRRKIPNKQILEVVKKEDGQQYASAYISKIKTMMQQNGTLKS